MGAHDHHRNGTSRNTPLDTAAIPAASAPPSNERLLCTAFVSFQCFAIAQTIAAVIAGSEALLGDSFAMMVDAFTYLFNWFAERQKVLYAHKLQLQEHTTGNSSTNLRALEYRKYTYQLELVPPLISVSTLLVVTVFVLKESIQVLVLDSKRDVSEQADPNVKLMMLFSFLNLLLDVLNVCCFASAKHALGYNTTPDIDDMNENSRRIEQQQPRYRDDDDDDGDDGDDRIQNGDNHTRIKGNCGAHQDDDDNACEIEMMERKVNGSLNGNDHDGDDNAGEENDKTNGNVNGQDSHDSSDDDEEDDDFDEMSPIKGGESRRLTNLNGHIEQQQQDEEEEETSNLNMCSAYTHVFADTLRSLAVILASLLAEFTSAVTSEVADSTAAVVVSALIMLSLLPLFGGMVQTFGALKRVNRQIEEERLRQRQDGGQSETVLFEDEADEEEAAEPSSKKAVIQFV